MRRCSISMADDIAFSQHSLVPVLHQFKPCVASRRQVASIRAGGDDPEYFDTTVSVQMAKTHRLLLKELDATIAALDSLALAHKATPLAVRTDSMRCP